LLNTDGSSQNNNCFYPKICTIIRIYSKNKTKQNKTKTKTKTEM
jgi:hypothetical protein